LATLLAVNSYFYRRDGSEAVFFEHNKIYSGAGWQVVPFAMRHPDNLDTSWSEYFVTETEFGQTYSLAQKLRRVPKVLYSLEARRNISRLIKRIRPDLCHCHTVYHHLSPSVFGALRSAGIPTVMTLHDLKIACPAYHMANDAGLCEKCKGGRLHNVVRNRCIKGSASLSALAWAEAVLHSVLNSYSLGVDVFIAPCRFYVDKLVEWGWPRNRFAHIPNPVDVQGTRPSFAPGTAFLYFGRLAPGKGLVTLIRASAQAGVQLQLAGRGPLRQELEAVAASCGAQVEFLGYLEGHALAAAIGASRATVLPSEWFENAPMSILESCAMGKPVIASRIGGIPELVRDRETGWLFEAGSLSQLAGILRAVADAPSVEVETMGRAARHLMENEFSTEQYFQRMNNLYASLGVVA